MAPDNAFRVAVRLPAPVPPAIGPDAALKQARPMVTWRSQEEIDSVPLEAMSPGSVRRTARVVRRLAGAALDRPRTRVGVLAGWNLATRVVRSNRLASWQGLIDARMSLISPTPLEARLARGAGRRVYSRTLGSPCSRGIRKSVNVLAARHERDTADALVSLPQRTSRKERTLPRLPGNYPWIKQRPLKAGSGKDGFTEGSNDLGIDSVEEVSKAIFSTDAGGLCPPVKSGNDYYLFKVEEKKPGRTREYEEVKELVRNDYMNAKMTSVYQQLVQQMLGSTEVKLYPEVITEEESAQP